MNVIDNLESTSSSDALSANMGRELNEYAMAIEEYAVSIEESVTDLKTRVTDLENNSGGSETSQCDCETKIWTTAIE